MEKKLALMKARNEAITRMQALCDAANAENRAMNQEEENNYQAAFAAQADAKKELDSIVTGESRSKELADLQADMKTVQGTAKRGTPGDDGGKKAEKRMTATQEYRDMFDHYLKTGEVRDNQMDIPTKGGFLVAPEQMVAGILKNIDDMVDLRMLATKYQVTTAHSLGVVTQATDIDDAEWTSELATGSVSSGPTFGKRELNPHPLAKQALCSAKLLRASAINVEQWLLDRMSYKFGTAQENAFMTGSGVNQPLGVFTVSGDGIPAGQDVLTGSATDYTFDGLIDAQYKLKDMYRRMATWLLPRTGVQKIAKLKDLENRYLWEPSRQIGTPDVLLGRPVISSEFVPAVFTTGLYVGMFADFSNYWIADALDMQVVRLNELGALTNQVYYVGRMETDGQPVRSEAFARLKTN